MNDEKKKELTALLDRHPEMYDRILRLLREQVSDPATTQEPKEEDD